MFGGLTWLGLLIAAAGWVMLLFGAGVDASSYLGQSRGSAMIVNIHLLSIAENIILSGFGIAMLGALPRSARAITPTEIADYEPTADSLGPSVEPKVGRQRFKIPGGGSVPYTILPSGEIDVYYTDGTRRYPSLEALRKHWAR